MKSLFCRHTQVEILAELFNQYPKPYKFDTENKEKREKYVVNLHYLSQKGLITDCVVVNEKISRSEYEIKGTVLTVDGLDGITEKLPNHDLENVIGQVMIDLGYTGGNH